MADKSKIEWTDATWNIITGCSRKSTGCNNCYAEKLAGTRLKHHPSRKGLVDHNGRWNGKVRFNTQWLELPLKWKKPRQIFVCAHGDLFHENVPDGWIDAVWGVMTLAHRHTFQVLTKRPERMRDYVTRVQTDFDAGRRVADAAERMLGGGWFDLVLAAMLPLPNVWLGTSVENQATYDERIPALLDTPAEVRWISAEPLLGPIDLGGACKLEWCVVGGESGPGARRMDPDWARSLRDQCVAHDVPFFFKQWGGIHAKKWGRVLDERVWDEMPKSFERRTV